MASFSHSRTAAAATPEERMEVARKYIADTLKKDATWQTTLNFGYMDLTDLPQEILQLASTVNVLILHHNHFAQFPTIICSLPKIERVQLSYNQLEALPFFSSSLAALPHLTKLELTANRFTVLPPVLSTLTNLTDLTIGENQLTSIPPGSLPTSLTSLDLNINVLDEIGEGIYQLENLTSLGVAYNNLRSIPDHITRLTKLERFDLGSNQLKSIPTTLSSFSKLKTLNLSSNQVSNIDELDKMPSIEYLDISFNDIEELPPKFPLAITSLRFLKLSGNKFENLPSDFSSRYATKDNEGTPQKFPTLPFTLVYKNILPNLILPHLYLGSMEAAQNKHSLKKLGITHILTVADGLPAIYPDQFTYRVIDVDDHPSVDLSVHFEDCLNFIDVARKKNNSVLVHCAAGISRSASIVIAYVMRTKRCSFDSAFDFVQKKRPMIDPNPGFKKQLQQYEEHLLNNEENRCVLS